MNRFPRHARCLLAAVLTGAVVTGGPRSAAAQTGAAGTGGVTRLAQQERLANNRRRVLMIGAHPDDEDTELLTILARGEGMETAYLSLTRGDGGQNLIGPELGEALGVLRTEELAAARQIDGGKQFFTRAFDFGFSKTADETLRFWNRDSVLKDMVRVIRRFRPQVIVSVWQGTPADGHGHHQASGILSLEAYHAAGDPKRFPELQAEGLSPWQPSKFYRSAGRGGGGGATLTFDGGVIDPATGFSLRQLAVQSRSQHRSQNQGNLEELGPSSTGIRLVERAPDVTGPDDSLFAGITPLANGTDDVHVSEAELTSAGIVVDATTTDDEVTPGERIPVTISVWNTSHYPATARTAMLLIPGFDQQSTDCVTHALASGELYRCTVTLAVRAGAVATSPYYLRLPRAGAMYQWSGDAALWGQPSAPPLQVDFTIGLRGGTSHVTREVLARYRDPVLGEVRHPVMIVPRIAVDLQPNALLWPSGVTSRPFKVALDHLTRDSSDAIVSLVAPKGWSVTAPQRVHFTREGEHAMLTFNLTAPARAASGTYHVSARAVSDGDTLDVGVERIRYPHVRDRNIATVARATVVVADVRFPSVGTIGYVRGGGDVVPEAMTNAGLAVSLLDGDALERGSFDRFKVIVIGPRAYEANASLRVAHPRLMRWLNAGGTLIIQYQQTPWVSGGFPPVPLRLVSPTQSRVTDETAPVTFLAPANPLMRVPNVIGASDFDGWVQERGLDFPPSWDAAWTPLLEMHDAGGPPLQGGLLVARVGRGTAVYTGLAFHRQLPVVVPGAWRLWANILGAGQTSPSPRRVTAH